MTGPPLHAAPPAGLEAGVPLAPLTTLGLGGPAGLLVDADRDATVVDALAWAATRALPVAVLGGGSNVVVADRGFDGLVLRLATRGLRVERGAGVTTVTAAAGEPWDDLVAWAVAQGLGGIECLSGIPGTVGATPIQNVGAYGQEVAETLTAVRVFDRDSAEERAMAPAECGLAYRDSVFRRHPDRWVILSVTFSLRAGRVPTLAYPELVRALAPRMAPPAVADVREAVLELRRAKSMLLDAGDPNRRSVGSFFLNPVLPVDAAEAVVARAVGRGAAASPAEVPRFAAGPGKVKLSAAWLVERAGFARGLRRGPVGLSSRHALSLVHHGGGRSDLLVALAADIQEAVHARFGVLLHPEPTFLGFPTPPLRP